VAHWCTPCTTLLLVCTPYTDHTATVLHKHTALFLSCCNTHVARLPHIHNGDSAGVTRNVVRGSLWWEGSVRGMVVRGRGECVFTSDRMCGTVGLVDVRGCWTHRAVLHGVREGIASKPWTGAVRVLCGGRVGCGATYLSQEWPTMALPHCKLPHTNAGARRDPGFARVSKLASAGGSGCRDTVDEGRDA
jgi:hypothetical protein